MFGALTNRTCVWRALHSKHKCCVTSYFSYLDLLKIHLNHIFKFCKKKNEKSSKCKITFTLKSVYLSFH